jgi:hypothetical protein
LTPASGYVIELVTYEAIFHSLDSLRPRRGPEMRSPRSLTLPPCGPQPAAPNPIFQIFNRDYEILEVVENTDRSPSLIGTKTALFEEFQAKARPLIPFSISPQFPLSRRANPCMLGGRSFSSDIAPRTLSSLEPLTPACLHLHTQRSPLFTARKNSGMMVRP